MIEVDYHASCESVYKQAMCTMIKSSGTEALRYCGLSKGHSDIVLPSWVTDWSTIRQYWITPPWGLFSAAKFRKEFIDTSSAKTSGILSLEAVRVDTVEVLIALDILKRDIVTYKL